MQISPISNVYINQKKASQNAQYKNAPIAPSFTGVVKKSKFFTPITEPVTKIKNKIETQIAHVLVKMFETKTAEKIIEKTKESKKLVSHLTALTGLVLSGFYIDKTLKNDKLDSQKRKTLAINQAIVTVLSTIGGYTLEEVLNARIDRFVKKFLEVNKHEPAEMLAKYETGIRTAASVMIFGIIYRFIGPVIATPIANIIGNHIHAKNEAKNPATVNTKKN